MTDTPQKAPTLEQVITFDRHCGIEDCGMAAHTVTRRDGTTYVLRYRVGRYWGRGTAMPEKS